MHSCDVKWKLQLTMGGDGDGVTQHNAVTILFYHLTLQANVSEEPSTQQSSAVLLQTSVLVSCSRIHYILLSLKTELHLKFLQQPSTLQYCGQDTECWYVGS